MSYTNPIESRASLYVAAQDRKDCCAGCKASDKRGEGDGAFLWCATLKRRTARFATCAQWAPVRRMVTCQ